MVNNPTEIRDRDSLTSRVLSAQECNIHLGSGLSNVESFGSDGEERRGWDSEQYRRS